jgi:hypothetical protein
MASSGDYPDTRRRTFPKNTQAFRVRYGETFTQMLINEANKTRRSRGFGPQQWVYKGYGIYQYDLQFVVEDEMFFRNRQWYQFDQCLSRLMKELKENFQTHKDIWRTVKAYNGSGESVTRYANNVVQFVQYCSEVVV